MEVLRATLFKTYSAIEIHRVKWNEILLSFSAPVKALSSLSDQLDCVLKAKPCELSSKFPFLKGRLEQIIRALMEEEITAMLLLIEELSVLNQKLKSSCEVSSKLYLENFSTLHEDSSFFKGTSTCPPMSQMIEWLEDINISYTNKFTNLKFLVEIYDCTPELGTQLQNLLDSKKDFSTVEAIMAKMCLFLQEK